MPTTITPDKALPSLNMNIGPEVYMSIILLLLFIIMFGIVLFSPFIKPALAMLSKKKILGIIDRTRQIRFETADIRNGMYYFNNKPWRFVKQYPGAFWIGRGVPFELVHIDIGFVQDPFMNAAVEELKEKYGIDNYIELQRAIDDGIIDKDDDILVPLFFRVPMDSLLNYGAVVPPSDITGEVEDLVEDRRGEIGTLRRLMPYAIIFLMIVMGGAVAFAIVTNL